MTSAGKNDLFLFVVWVASFVSTFAVIGNTLAEDCPSTKAVETIAIVSAQSPPVSVCEGTPADKLVLPFSIDVELEEAFSTITQPTPSRYTKVPVVWDTSTFDPALVGKAQTIKGALKPTYVKTIASDIAELTQKPIANDHSIEAAIEVTVRKVSRELYIEADAAADGDGSKEKPFNSIQTAKEFIAEKGYNDAMTGDILVWVGNGTYRMTEPIQFGLDDSGSNGYSVIYQGAGGDGMPELMGGVYVTGWTPWDKNPNVYVTDLDRDTKLRNLIVNNTYAQMTKATGIQTRGEYGSYSFDDSEDWALEGGTVVAGVRLRWDDIGFVEGTTPDTLTNPDDIEIEQKKTWNSVTCGIADVIEIAPDQFGDKTYGPRVGLREYYSQYYVGMGHPGDHDKSKTDFQEVYQRESVKALMKEADCAFIFTQPYGAITTSLAWRCNLDPYLARLVRNTIKATVDRKDITLRNALELLKNPGEFYFDKVAHKLYYYPLEGEDIHAAEVIVPVSEGLIRIYGEGSESDAQRVVGLQFRGIKFSADDRDLMHVVDSKGHHSTGFASVQNVVPYTKYTSHGRWHESFYNITDTPAGTIDVINAKRIVFEGNLFVNLSSTTAVNFVNDVTDSRVTGNVFMNNAGNAVVIGHPQHVYIGDDPDDPAVKDNRFQPGVEGVCKNIIFSNNDIENVSTIFIQGDAITAFFVENCEISHNTVVNVPYSAICLGWGWGDQDGRDTAINPGKPSTSARKNVIVYNNIQKTNQKLPKDGGPLYTLGQQEDSIIAYNYISGSRGGNKRDIYTDEGTAHYEVFGNKTGSYFTNKGHKNVVYGNDSTTASGQGAFFDKRIAPQDIRTNKRITLSAPFPTKPLLSADEILAGAGCQTSYEQEIKRLKQRGTQR